MMFTFVKPLFLLLILASATLFMPHAKAACTTPDIPKQFSLRAVFISTTLPVGSTIPGTDQSMHVSGHCDNPSEAGNPIISCYYGTGAEIPGMAGVYTTGVEGVGITLINDKGQRISGGGVGCNTTATPLGQVSNDGNLTFSFDVTIALVKTGENVVSGTLEQDQTKFGVGVYQRDGIGSPNVISYSGNIIIKQVTCTVTPATLTVLLGDVPTSLFNGAGTTLTKKTVDLTLTCNNSVQPVVKISSANGYETDYPGVVKLTQENGVATGVGVKVLVDNVTPTFDTYMEVSTPTVANVPADIPISVAYEQVSDTVTPGPANTVATITLGYK